MKVFIATPYTQFCDQNNLLKEEYKNFFLKLTNTLKEEKVDYFLALEREKWGEEYVKDSLSTEIDYNAVLDCDLFLWNLRLSSFWWSSCRMWLGFC